LHHRVVAGGGSGHHPYPFNPGDYAGLPLHHQHHLHGGGQPRQALRRHRHQRVPPPTGGRRPVPPPAVRHRTHHVGGVHHQQRRLRATRGSPRPHPVIVARRSRRPGRTA